MLRAALLRLLPFAALLVLPACYLEEGPAYTSAYTVRTTTPAGYTQVGGVQVWARSEWSGSPTQLWRQLTPIKVTIENHSGHPLRLGYREFSLVGSSGFRYVALPPFPVQAPVSEAESLAPEAAVASTEASPLAATLVDVHGARPVAPAPRVLSARPGPRGHSGRPMGPVRPYFRGSHFRVAHHYAPFWPLFMAWPLAWAASDYAWYDRYYRDWPEQLPTEDMVNQALPEGVLEDGGTIAGLLYFQYAGRENATRLDLNLVDASTQQPFATASVPVALLR